MLPWRKTRPENLTIVEAEAQYGPVRDIVVSPTNSVSTLTKPDPWLVEALLGKVSAAGFHVTPVTAMGLPTVFACVNAVSRSMASIPLKMYRRTSDGGREEAVNHYLYPLLHDAPNDEMTSSTFRRTLFANAVLRNQAFAEIVKNGLDEIAEIYPICNKDIKPDREFDGGPLFYVMNGKRVEKERIIHLRGLTFDGVNGADIPSLGRDAIGLAIALQDHAAKYFPNASTPTLVATSPAANLSPAQIEQIRDEIISRTSGANAHKPMVLLNGAKVEPVKIADNQKGQFTEERSAQDKAICRFFGVPPAKAGLMEDAHFNNVWEMNESYITDCLLPWAVETEQTLNQRLLSLRERGRYYFEFNFDALLRGNPEQRAMFYEKMVQIGAMNRNGVRARENLNPVPGGDSFMISQNLQLLDNDGKPVPKPKEATQPTPTKNQ